MTNSAWTLREPKVYPQFFFEGVGRVPLNGTLCHKNKYSHSLEHYTSYLILEPANALATISLTSASFGLCNSPMTSRTKNYPDFPHRIRITNENIRGLLDFPTGGSGA